MSAMKITTKNPQTVKFYLIEAAETFLYKGQLYAKSTGGGSVNAFCFNNGKLWSFNDEEEVEKVDVEVVKL